RPSSRYDHEFEPAIGGEQFSAQKRRQANNDTQLEASENPGAGTVGPIGLVHTASRRTARKLHGPRIPNTDGRTVQNGVEDSRADRNPFAELPYSKHKGEHGQCANNW